MLKNRAALLSGLVFISLACFGNTAWIHGKAWLAQILIERAWSEVLQSGEAVRPWRWADFWPVARLEFNQTGEQLYVLSNASGAALAFGPGHINGSASPATRGTSIIAAHRDTHFNLLQHINTGEQVSVQRTDGVIRQYRVINSAVVDIRNSQLSIRPDDEMLKLVTCYPFDAIAPGGTQRLVVSLMLDQPLPAG